MTGERDVETGMWEINLDNSDTSALCNNLLFSTSPRDVILYLHAACFSPGRSTWIDAISNGNYATWPSLTVENVRKYLPPEGSPNTIFGHMNLKRKNLNSTKVIKDDFKPPVKNVLTKYTPTYLNSPDRFMVI